MCAYLGTARFALTQANGSIRSIPIPTDGSIGSASPLHQSASPRDTPAELATSSRHVRQKRGSHVTQERLPAPSDGLSDAAPSSDGDASPDGDDGSKPRPQKAQRPAFSVSAVAFADDPADSRPGSAPSSPGSSTPGFDICIGARAGGTRGGDDAADTLSASLQSLSAPSHLSTESQTALAQESALAPALHNSLASLSRSPAGGSRLMPSALHRAPGGLGSHGSQAGSPALSQAGDEPHREAPPDQQEEEEEELSLAALPLKRPAPDHSSGSAGTGEDSSEVTFGAGVGGGGAESRLRAVPGPGDEGLEVQSAPHPTQPPPADAPSHQVRAGLLGCAARGTGVKQQGRWPSADLTARVSGSTITDCAVLLACQSRCFPVHEMAGGG